MIRPKGLGRGLDALLAGTDDAAPSKDALQMLAIDRLRPGRYQPRTKMDDASLAELAEAIREQGVMQPILVRPVEAGRFEIVAGDNGTTAFVTGNSITLNATAGAHYVREPGPLTKNGRGL